MKNNVLRPSYETVDGLSFEGSLLYLGGIGIADGVASAPPQGAVASEPGSGTTAHDKITPKISRSDCLEPSS